MYSLKYGTVPVVRATGGLEDTVEEFDPGTGRGTGFKFLAYDGPALLGAVREALSIFRGDSTAWRRIQLNGMAQDFSWQVSATEYGKVYEAARKSRNLVVGSSSNLSGGKSAKMSPVTPLGKGSHGR
jgi:starch synthase